ncbi:MAG TPA: glycoside hydrolase family 140 protein [Bryobacteraceae bacterium]
MRAAILFALSTAAAFAAEPVSPIAVSANHRFLQYQDGKPFFWLGDTAWLLTSRLDRADTLTYLDNRAHKGFNVIQVSLLHTPQIKNAAGTPALVDANPAQPDLRPNGYWDHVDWVLDQAAQRGLWLAMLPAWGSAVKTGVLNAGNAVFYATFLAHRYRDKPNVIWVLGGDVMGDVHPEVVRLLGQTLRAEDPHHLITYHPFGRTESLTWFNREPWLDFNMFQSGHSRYDQDTRSPHLYGEDNWRYVHDSYTTAPAKPVIDGEPSYENIPQGLHDPAQPRWTAADCRRYAYWSVFAGAAGHTYGDNSVMQFYTAGGRPAFGATQTWREAIDDPGSSQMQYLKKLMLSRSYFDRVPDQNLIAGQNGTKYDYVEATRGSRYLFAYTYTGKPFRVKLGALKGATVRAAWYSPRNGSQHTIGTFKNQGIREFTPPGKPEPGNDWVLILDAE